MMCDFDFSISLLSDLWLSFSFSMT
jgi:hypothetical protein